MNIMNSITTIELHNLLEDKKNLKDIYLIDIREEFELSSGYIESAINIPMGKILEHVEDFKKRKSVYFICHTGSRSSMVCRELISRGVNAIDVTGGMMVWYMNMFNVVK